MEKTTLNSKALNVRVKSFTNFDFWKCNPFVSTQSTNEIFCYKIMKPYV